MSADYVITLKLARLLDTPSKLSFAFFLVSGLKDKKSIKSKPTWKLEAYKLYSREMWTFLSNVIKIDSYNIELCRFKVGAFFSDTVYYYQLNCQLLLCVFAVEDNAAESTSDCETELEENRRLRETRTCKVCMDREVNTVFLPCGHLVCCDTCSPVLRNCAVCRSLIRGTVKVFLG